MEHPMEQTHGNGCSMGNSSITHGSVPFTGLVEIWRKLFLFIISI